MTGVFDDVVSAAKNAESLGLAMRALIDVGDGFTTLARLASVNARDPRFQDWQQRAASEMPRLHETLTRADPAQVPPAAARVAALVGEYVKAREAVEQEASAALSRQGGLEGQLSVARSTLRDRTTAMERESRAHMGGAIGAAATTGPIAGFFAGCYNACAGNVGSSSAGERFMGGGITATLIFGLLVLVIKLLMTPKDLEVAKGQVADSESNVHRLEGEVTTAMAAFGDANERLAQLPMPPGAPKR